MKEEINKENVITEYSKQGFLIARNLISAHRLNKVLSAYDDFVGLNINPAKQHHSMHVVHDIVLYETEFMMLALNASILDYSELLLGTKNIRLHHSKINIKPCLSNKSSVPWHQDFVFFPHTNSSLLACTVYLSETNLNNGALSFAVGSHKDGLYNHYDENDNFKGRIIDQKNITSKYAIKTVEAKPGDVLFHNSKIVHSSNNNETETPRKCITFQHVAGDAVQLGGRQHKCHGLFLRGAMPKDVRISENGRVRLPFEIEKNDSPLVIYRDRNLSKRWGNEYKK